MDYQNNISILPFFYDLKFQHHRKSYVYGQFHPTSSIIRQLPPFQFIDTYTSSNNNLIATIRRLSDNSTHDITAAIELKLYTDYRIIICQGGTDIDSSAWWQTGKHQVEIALGDVVGSPIVYSEIFCLKSDLSDQIKCEYWNNQNMAIPNGHIIYNSGFRHKIYVDSILGKPRYTYEETAQNRNGRKFIIHQISKKVFRFSFLATESQIDAWRLVQLHDNIEITYQGILYKVDNISMSVEWLENGDLANIDIEFETNTVATSPNASDATEITTGTDGYD